MVANVRVNERVSMSVDVRMSMSVNVRVSMSVNVRVTGTNISNTAPRLSHSTYPAVTEPMQTAPV